MIERNSVRRQLLALGVVALLTSNVEGQHRHRMLHVQHAPDFAPLATAPIAEGATMVTVPIAASTPVRAVRLAIYFDGCEMLPLGPLLEVTAATVTFADGHSVPIPAFGPVGITGVTSAPITTGATPAAVRSVQLSLRSVHLGCIEAHARVDGLP